MSTPIAPGLRFINETDFSNCGNGLRGLAVVDQHKTQKPVSHGIVTVYSEIAARFAHGVVISRGRERREFNDRGRSELATVH